MLVWPSDDNDDDDDDDVGRDVLRCRADILGTKIFLLLLLLLLRPDITVMVDWRKTQTYLVTVFFFFFFFLI